MAEQTRNKRRLYWLKLPENFFRRKEIKRLRRIAGGDTFTVIYQEMLLLAMNNSGLLSFDGFDETFAKEIALELDEDPDNVQMTVNYLLRTGLMTEVTPDEYHLLESDVYTGSESVSAERVRRFRENQKALQCNTPVTQVKRLCNVDIDTEIEIEKDTEIEREKDTEKKHPLSPSRGKLIDFKKLVNEFAGKNTQLKEALNDWVSMRCEMAKKKKETFTLRALKTALKKLHNLSNGNEGLALDIVNEGIEGSWKSFYPLNDNRQKNKGFGDILDEYVDYAKEHSQ